MNLKELLQYLPNGQYIDIYARQKNSKKYYRLFNSFTEDFTADGSLWQVENMHSASHNTIRINVKKNYL